MKPFRRERLEALLLFGVALCVAITAAATTAQAIEEHPLKPMLWDPDAPVDIMVHNPLKLDLELPEPYLPPSLEDRYGPGATEDIVQTRTRVGENVSFGVEFSDAPGEGFHDPDLGAQRRAAFWFGADAWAASLQGPGWITVNATMTPMGGDSLSAVIASASAASYYRNFTNAPRGGTWYPEALVEVISGTDPNTSQFDINVDFNSDIDDTLVLGQTVFYYGVDGNNGENISFATITIHEICHGLGFSSSFNAAGEFGGGTSDPFIFDHFLIDDNDTLLINQPASSALVTLDDVNWIGLHGMQAYGNDFGGALTLPMFAPTPYDPGSSISHIDEDTFTGDWELMTPHNDRDPLYGPDTIVLGILQDIGWSLPRSRYVWVGATGFEDGSSGNPFNEVAEGIADVDTSGSVFIYPGTHTETMIVPKPVKLHSAGGVAVIGDQGTRRR